MTVFHEFDDVDKFTIGTIGEPGARVFYLQIRAEGLRLAVKCEKQQASAISDYLRRVLNDLPEPTERPIAAAMELMGPIDAAFVLGPVGLGYDRSNDMVLLQLEEVIPVDEEGEPLDEDPDRGHIRMFLTRNQAHAFCSHAENIVAAGRPSCVWCANPINPDGHFCVRMN